METYSKSLALSDYEDPRTSVIVSTYQAITADPDIPHLPDIQHPHRVWESFMAILALREVEGIETVLEVGSGGSVFALMLSMFGYDVTVVDPHPRVQYARQSKYPVEVWEADFMGVRNLDQKFDAVLCLSVIEHIEEHGAFFWKMMDTAARALILTTDFSMDGGEYVPDHLRTYSPVDLQVYLDEAKRSGYESIGPPDWRFTGNHINGLYNFASLALEREGG